MKTKPNHVANLLMSGLIVVTTATISSCFLFHDSYPNNSCESNLDCFQAAGEICNTATGECEVLPDAAPRYDAPPIPDAPTPDASGDGDGDGDGDDD